MAESGRCQDLRNVYLQHVDDLGHAELRLFSTKKAVENRLREIQSLEQSIRLAQSSAASGVAATGKLGRFGIIPSIAILVNNEEKIAKLERQLEEARRRLEVAKRLVAELARKITGYRWGIENTPKEMAQNGCEPV